MLEGNRPATAQCHRFEIRKEGIFNPFLIFQTRPQIFPRFPFLGSQVNGPTAALLRCLKILLIEPSESKGLSKNYQINWLFTRFYGYI